VELAKVKYESSFNYQADSLEPKGHYFTFKLPYAGNTVEWEVLFDRKQPTKAPDFVLCGPEYMVCDPSMYSRVVQTWNTQDPLCLSKLLPILKFLYSEHQVTFISQIKEEKMYNFPINVSFNRYCWLSSFQELIRSTETFSRMVLKMITLKCM